MFDRPTFKAPILLHKIIINSWMKQTWLSMAQFDIHPQLHILDFPLQWVHDLELVKLFLRNVVWQPQLSMLHHCHMFLKALHLSDICNGTGNQILLQCLNGMQLITLAYSWPRTPTPTMAEWHCWQTTLTNLLHLGLHQTLASLLSEWTEVPKNGGWYLEQTSCALWHNTDEGWSRHGKIPG